MEEDSEDQQGLQVLSSGESGCKAAWHLEGVVEESHEGGGAARARQARTRSKRRRKTLGDGGH